LRGLRAVTQVALPVVVSPVEVMREKTLGGAITLCAKAAGYEGKQVQQDLKFDKAQWSRWESGQEGIVWPKLVQVMDHCGNDAPLMWLNFDRGYDIDSMRKRETELQRQVRMLTEENTALRRVLAGGAR
jgi:plasmid maintenance system antidote protein VapI